jgi:hypothetical protein
MLAFCLPTRLWIFVGGGLWFVGCTLGRGSDACLDFGENGRGGRLIFLSILSQLIHVLLSFSPSSCGLYLCVTIIVGLFLSRIPLHPIPLFYQVASLFF